VPVTTQTFVKEKIMSHHNNRDTEKAYKEKHAVEIKKWSHQYYLDHKEETIQRAKEWQTTNYKKKRVIDKNWEAKNPEKVSAHHKINNAIRDGKLVKPKTCEVCGNAPNRLEAHHWHGYDTEHIFDVQWLCHQCHVNVDFGMARPGTA
jgi:hypothetical protein